MGELESDSDPARILRRVMTYVVEAMRPETVVVVRQGVDGACEIIRAMGSLGDSPAAEHIIEQLPRAFTPGRGVIEDSLVVLPVDTYHLVAFASVGQRFDAGVLPLVELITRHAGQALENARLRDALAQSESLSAVGKAVKRVLHDLRNPIGRIHVAVDRANVPGTDAETVRRMHAIISSAADDVLTIANEVNDFTNSSKVTKVRLTAESLLKALTDGSAGRIALRCTNEHAGAIHCDPQKLLRALSRLIESAGDPGVSDGVAEVEVHAMQDGADSVITITGRGRSMPEALRVTLFEPFAAHAVPGPKGLGLATARSIVRAHGGEVSIGESNVCCFVVRLPSAVDSQARPRTAASGKHSESVLS